MAAQDFELILRVQADLQTAVGQLRALNDQMRVIKSSAQEASGGLQRLTNVTGAVESSARRAGAQLKSMVGIVAGLIAIRKIADFVGTVVEANQQLGDMAQKVGVSTETLSALGAVAKRSGSDLQGIQSAFVNLARAGTGLNESGVRALQAMNISLQQFRKLSPDQQFDLVAQKFAGYSDGANKAALATALLGKSGADLIPTLNEVGKQGLQSLTDEAIAAGTAVGGDAVRASQIFGNAMQTLKEKLAGAVNEGLVQFTPYIEDLSRMMDDPAFITNMKAVATAIADIGKTAVTAANGLASLIRNYAEYVAKKQNGAGGDDIVGMKLEQSDIQDELRLRQAYPVWSGINSFFAGAENNIIQNAVEGGRPRIQAMSTADLKTRLAQLDRSILHAATAKANASVKNPQEGDMRGLFVGESRQAPIVPGNGANAVDHFPEQIAKQAAAAQDALTQALIAQKRAVDPVTAAWEIYSVAEGKANQAAAEALKTHPAQAAAIEALRKAQVDLARVTRDAALDEIAAKDEKAWQDLQDSLRSPTEVNVDKAIAQIGVLNKALKDGKTDADGYRAMLQKIVTNALPKAPQLDFRGLVPSGIDNGGPLDYVQSQKDNELSAYQSRMDELTQLRQKEAISQHAFNAQAEQENQRHSKAMGQLQQAMYWAELATASQAFGQLAQLYAQRYGTDSRTYQVLFALSKTFAVAQAAESLAINVSKASEVGFPYNIPFIVGAFAQGAQIVSILDGASFSPGAAGGGGGYAEGGYTGAGAKHQVAGVVHAGEVVWSQSDIARAGGVGMVEAWRQGLRGYADGGFVHPLANAPSPAQLGFTAPLRPNVRLPDAANDGNGNRAPQVGVRIINAVDASFVTDNMATPEGEAVILNTIARNRMRVKQTIG